MSGIIGIFNLDGSPVEPDSLERMMASVAYRGPDEQKVWFNGNIGLGHAMLRTTPESLAEHQPCSLDGRIWIAADARLDNRADLIPSLERHAGYPLHGVSDTHLILHAYSLWGKNCLDKLLGDYALALWDPASRHLLCARDPMGIKPLYYTQNSRQLIFASAIGPILAAMNGRPAYNEILIKEFMADRQDRWCEETIYRAILSLRPGYRLEVSDARVNLQCCYNLHMLSELRYAKDRDYVEHFRDLIERAVASRARTSNPLGLQVSGGVDSSSVSSLLKHLSETGKHNMPSPILYSYVSEKFTDADERVYLKDLMNCCSPWNVRELDNDQMWALKDYEQDHGFLPDEPETWLVRRPTLDLYQAAKEDGCRTVMTGLGGDQVLDGDAYVDPQNLARIPLRQVSQEWKYFANKTDMNGALLFLDGLLLPRIRAHIPETIVKLKRSLLRGVSDWPKWIARDGAQEHNLLLPGFSARRIPSIYGGYWQKGMAMVDYTAAWAGLDLRHPYLDRRIVEYAYSLPSELLFREGFTKYVLREAMRGILPEKIRTRTSNGVCWQAVHYGWQRERQRIEKMLGHSRTCRMGWTKASLLRQAWSKYWQGDESETWNLNAWIALELWLASKEAV